MLLGACSTCPDSDAIATIGFNTARHLQPPTAYSNSPTQTPTCVINVADSDADLVHAINRACLGMRASAGTRALGMISSMQIMPTQHVWACLVYLLLAVAQDVSKLCHTRQNPAKYLQKDACVALTKVCITAYAPGYL